MDLCSIYLLQSGSSLKFYFRKIFKCVVFSPSFPHYDPFSSYAVLHFYVIYC